MFDFDRTVIDYPGSESFKFERFFILTVLLIISIFVALDVYIFGSSLFEYLADLEIKKSIQMTMGSISSIILAFFIPHTLDTISNISERYQSEVIINSFTSRWENTWFPVILIIHILLSGGLLFVEKLNHYDVWKILSWSSLFLFTYIVPKVGDYHIRTSKFVSSTDHILEELFQRAESIIE